MKKSKYVFRLICVLMAFAIMVIAVVTGDIGYSALGIGLLTLTVVGEMAEKIERMEKGMEK